MSKSSVLTNASRGLRRRVAPLALCLGVAALGSLAVSSQADAATLGNVFVVATATSNCGSHTVTVWPMTNEPLNGSFSVYSYAQVYDYNLGKWITTGWLLDNGIQGHIFYGITRPHVYAYVTYARVINGGWVYRQDRLTITPDLDSMGAFCNP